MCPSALESRVSEGAKATCCFGVRTGRYPQNFAISWALWLRLWDYFSCPCSPGCTWL